MSEAQERNTEIPTTKSEEKTEEQTPQCPYCKSDDVYGISRVVGYFSVIDNWKESKQSELKRRHKGNYWTGKDIESTISLPDNCFQCYFIDCSWENWEKEDIGFCVPILTITIINRKNSRRNQDE